MMFIKYCDILTSAMAYEYVVLFMNHTYPMDDKINKIRSKLKPDPVLLSFLTRKKAVEPLLSPSKNLQRRAEKLYFSNRRKSINLYIKSVFARIEAFEFKECTLDTYISLYEYVKKIVKRSVGEYKDILNVIEYSVYYCVIVKQARKCLDEGIVYDDLGIDLIKLDNLVEDQAVLVKLECLAKYIFENFEFE
ncbi:hypothetical protein THOM_2987 [Trachipleistophora hominis]|uniref:Uncharacterized protein n=1 Tax=Trachipleistophora hominis TaxID=72359 RepID=L7JSR9_TRAHO|nr:hypothetical protein THOM_2987 [Trachipleistophora hominis]